MNIRFFLLIGMAGLIAGCGESKVTFCAAFAVCRRISPYRTSRTGITRHTPFHCRVGTAC